MTKRQLDRCRAIWSEWHARASVYAGDERRERRYLETVGRQIPCGECRRNHAAYVTANPPNLDSAEKYAAWLVAYHNEVNRRLGKRQWSDEQARERWGQGREIESA